MEHNAISATFNHSGGGATTVPIGLVAPGGRNASLGFFGYVDSANPFNSVTFNVSSEIFGFDDMILGDVGQVIPEPSSLPLCGLAALGLLRRRR